MKQRWYLSLAVMVPVLSITGCQRAELDAANARLRAAQAQLESTQKKLKEAESRIQELEAQPKIELPKAEANSPVVAADDALVVNVSRDGKLSLGDQEVSPAELESSLVKAARENSEQEVLIRGSRAVKMQHVIQVIDICRRAGINNYLTATLNE